MLLLLLSAACQDPTTVPPPSGSSEPARAPDAPDARPAATYEDRAANAWNAAPLFQVGEGGARVATKVGRPVAVDNPATYAGFSETLVDLRKIPALFGTDEAAAADAVRAAGAHLVVVHRTLAPAFDHDSRVWSRLYHHGQLTRFQLARVEEDALFYLVVDEPLAWTPELAGPAMAWIRAKLEGRAPPPHPAIEAQRSSWRLVGVLRGQGQELAFSLAEAPTLDVALGEVADDLETMYRRTREILGFPRLARAMGGYTLELHRITETAQVLPRDEETLESLWELGVDGAVLLDRPTPEEKKAGKKGQSAVWPGGVAVTRGITKADSFLKAAAREFRWDSVRPWRDTDTELQLIRTTHFVESPSGPVRFYRGTAALPDDAVSLAAARDFVLLAGEWYLANLTPEGQVTYKFWPEENRWSADYNHVRHTLATWNLWQAWTLDPRPAFLEGAIRTQAWTLRSLQLRDATNLAGWESKAVSASPLSRTIASEGMAYFTHGDNTKLGSVVVALLGMIELARATNDHSLDPLLRKLGNFVLFMQEPSGTFRGYHVPEGHPYHGQVNDIVPGEAALSLVYLYEYFQDPRYLAPLEAYWTYYDGWFRKRAALRVAGAVWPTRTYANATRLELVQFGPWTVMAADAYTRVRPDAKQVAQLGFDVARWMIETYQYTPERTLFPDYVGGYFKFEGELPAMQAFCYAEGTAAAYAMAVRLDPAQAPYFEQATRRSVHFGLLAQHDALDTRAYSRPEQVIGGVRYAMNEPKVRIDYVHHALSAAYQWLVAARGDAALPAAVRADPSPELRRLFALQGMPSFRAGQQVAGAGFAPPVGAADATEDADAGAEGAGE